MTPEIENLHFQTPQYLVMEFPLEFGFGNIKISAHAVFETLAFVIGFRYFLYLRKRQADPITESNRIWIIIGAAVGALVFSRILGALENPKSLTDGSFSWLEFYAGKTIVGGLLGGLIGVESIKYILKEKSSSGDLFTFPLILAMIIGRIGCFFSGVHEPTFGVESGFMLAMDLGDGVNRHPVALYEIFFLISLWIVLSKVEDKYYFENGLKFKWFMIAYLSFRFLIEFIKPVSFTVAGLSFIQLACLGGLIYYSRTIFRLLRTPLKSTLQHE